MDASAKPGGWLRAWLGLERSALVFVGVMTFALVTYMGLRAQPPTWWQSLGRSSVGISDWQLLGGLYRIALAFAALALVPLVHLLVVERIGARELGLGLRGSGRMFLAVAAFFIAALPVLWLVAQTPAAARTYPRLAAAAHDPNVFVVYHAVYGLKWFAWEFYFRGALLLGGRRHFGTGAAVVLSTLPFTLVHLDKPLPELYGSFFFGLLLCAITLRARSIWPAVAVHWAINVALELMLVKW